LNIVRDGSVIRVDSKEVTLDLRGISVDFGSSDGVGNSSIAEYLEERVRKSVNMLLSGLDFSIVLDQAEPAVRFSIHLNSGTKPSALTIPRFFEGSWRAFLPDGTQEQRIYLDAVKQQCAQFSKHTEDIAAIVTAA
jgi:hypothetical protein